MLMYMLEKSTLQNYLDDGMSLHQVSKIENCSLSTVIYWTNKYHLKSSHTFRQEKYTKEALEKALPKVGSLVELANYFGSAPSGGTRAHLSNKLKQYGFDTSHFRKTKVAIGVQNKIPLEEILVRKDKSLGRTSHRILRRAMIESGVPYRCAVKGCPVTDTWLSKPVTLQVHHIDGDWSNNLLSNLQFLCPTCHTQTASYANNKSYKKRYYCDCGQEIVRNSKKCLSCANRRNRPEKEKIKWPSDTELAKLVWQKPRSTLALELGVSDKAIAQRCKRRGIEQPSRGHWIKVKYNKL